MDAGTRDAAASADVAEVAASPQIQDDPQLLALHRIFTNSKVIEGCIHHKVVWAQVKGYPWWPVRFALLCRLAQRARSVATPRPATCAVRHDVRCFTHAAATLRGRVLCQNPRRGA